jgi:hypothetical protein
MLAQLRKRVVEAVNKILSDEYPLIDLSGDCPYCGAPPMQSKKTSAEGEFTTYDASRGHCGLCGRLTCRGGCFK